MGFFSYIFGDPFAKELGQSLLEYFESEEFPMELLQDQKLNFLYFKFRINRLSRDKTLNDSNLFDRLDEIFAIYNEWRDKGSIKSK